MGLTLQLVMLSHANELLNDTATEEERERELESSTLDILGDLRCHHNFYYCCQLFI